MTSALIFGPTWDSCTYIGKKRYVQSASVWPFISLLCSPSYLQSLAEGWRGKEIIAIVCIDDCIVASKSQEQCLADEQLVTSDLDLAGFYLEWMFQSRN